jgi:hypothetical protein
MTTVTGAPCASPYPKDLNNSRRNFLRAGVHAGGAAIAVIAGAGVAKATGATLAAPTPFRIAEARYKAAEKRYNEMAGDLEERDPAAFKREQETYDAALEAVDTAPCETWEEFGDAFRLAVHDGETLPNDDLIMKLLADVRRLGGGARRA